MTNYTVRFNRGNRGWACDVYVLSADGTTSGPSVATGTGSTRDAAKANALALAGDPAIRAALTNADHRRPHWVQGPLGEQLEAQRKATATQGTPRKRPLR
jgi:hypothetical protein